MKIVAESIVTIYSDTMAFLLTGGLLFIASSFRAKKDEHSNKLFFLLCVFTMVNALSNGASYMLHHQNLGWPVFARMILPSIAELSTLCGMFMWLIYIDYKLYESWDRTRFVEKYFRLPIIVFGCLFVINLFTGVMFTVNENFEFVATSLFYVVMIFQYGYAVTPIITYIRYYTMHGKKHFFHISPMVIPAAVAAVFTLLSNYSARAFGFAIALVFIYFSYINRWRFDDPETGFYNKRYISHVMAMARDGKKDYHSAMIFEVKNIPIQLINILKAEVPENGEIIRIEKNKLLLFSESSKSSMIRALSALIKDDTDEYDRTHEDEPIDLDVLYSLRKRNESSEDFVKRTESDAMA